MSNVIYDVKNDPGQQNPIRDEKLEKYLSSKMTELMIRYDAPDCQFERMKLTEPVT